MGGKESSTHDDALCAQCEGGSQAASVRDAAGSKDGGLACQVDDLWYEHHGGHISAVATCLATLRNEHIRSGLQCRSGLTDV